jgi:hypothetical protein
MNKAPSSSLSSRSFNKVTIGKPGQLRTMMVMKKTLVEIDKVISLISG